MTTLDCGSLDNNCAAAITQGCADMTDVSNNLVAAVSDCIASPFLCTYDTITTLDSLNGFVADVIAAIGACNQGSSEPSALALNAFFQAQNDNRGQRRLQDTPSAGAAEQSESAAARDLQAEAQAPRDQLAPKSIARAPVHTAVPPMAKLVLPATTLDTLEKLQRLSNRLRARLTDRLNELVADQGAPKPTGDRQVVV
eukprot:CAMPEP_0198501322 /NCGR_PEP_ID=MMETSP1462-20131121/8649_1 /TAXON_ID=1333877 /ORGANISM="Brandtodinium nutriculum, Strain RCC3387" /LENGTH=197 /DNA_ID=CAMNT_0044230361 /DNA_START=45 /DNA_END=638 /DNA_ORIENTATION=+